MIYSTEPATELPGFDKDWLIVEPDEAEAPLILPVIVPKVQLKLLGALEVKFILVEVPLHIVFVAAFVTAGIGLTVTVTVEDAPAQEPPVEVGVTTYSTEPAVALLGLVKV